MNILIIKNMICSIFLHFFILILFIIIKLYGIAKDGIDVIQN
jgi:hypothetical protein